MKALLPLVFVLGAVLCWGVYVPSIHHGQMGFGDRPGPLRAFLFVGIAYVLIAVLIPGVMIFGAKVEPAEFAAKGIQFSVLAGIVGALGALCVIFALKSGGTPLYVAPLVFAGAPIVNAFVSMTWDKPKTPPHMMFYVGLVLAAVGAGLVLGYKPK